jgi:hypothetical protein
MFSSVYSVYCLYVNVSCTAATGCQHQLQLNKYIISYHIIRNISQADLQKVFANKNKRVQACIDARGHHL